MLFWWPRFYLEGQHWNLGGWGQILAYMAFCEVFHDQSPGTLAAGGDFGFKVLTASDRAEKLSAELTGGRLAMMAIIGMFFQVGIGAVHVLFVPSLWSIKQSREVNSAEQIRYFEKRIGSEGWVGIFVCVWAEQTLLDASCGQWIPAMARISRHKWLGLPTFGHMKNGRGV